MAPGPLHRRWLRGALAALMLAPIAVCGEGPIPPIPELETVPPGEAEDIAAAVLAIKRQVLRDFIEARREDQEAEALRDAHAKHHGCVRAQVSVDPTLPAALHSPVFRPGASYDAWVRFSNAAGRPDDDGTPDARGMAIKLMQVPGPKLLDGVFADSRWFRFEAGSQDLVLINNNRFFVGDAADYRRFVEATTSPRRLRLLLFFAARPRQLAIALDLLRTPVATPLDQHYQSLVPFLFGDGRAAQFSALPVHCEDGSVIPSGDERASGPGALREALVSALDPDTGEAACFDLGARVRVDLRLPVEDATVAWDETGAPRFSLARLTIPPQTFDTPAQMAFCEALSFSPWHGVTDHQPLGGLNRARLHAYKEVSELRHWLNGTPPSRPEGGDR